MSLLVLESIFLTTVCLLPLSTTVQIGADEGFEMAKAELCIKGQQLYTKIWNDQPPLHTFLVAFILKHFSSTMLGPRLLTMGFALSLLTSVFLMIRRLSGFRVALFASALIIMSPGFIDLSSSCMLEIPSLATAMISLAILVQVWPRRRFASEFLAGLVFGAALEIKLVPLMLVALIPVIFWLRDGAKLQVWKSVAASLAVFCCALFLSYTAIDVWLERGAYLRHFQQAWSSHFGPSRSVEYGSADDFPFNWLILLKNWDLAVPALLGFGLCLRRIRTEPAAALPPLWLGLTILVFAIHKPWWPYYYVHIAIPLCWCAAIGLCEMASIGQMPWRRPLQISFALYGLCAVPWMAGRAYLETAGIRALPRTYATPVLAQVEKYKPLSHYMFADRPIFSFHTGIPLPPNLAVLPLKRFWAGEMTNGRLAAELNATRPELLLLQNDTRERPFQELMHNEYRLVYVDPESRLYVRSDVARRIPAWKSTP